MSNTGLGRGLDSLLPPKKTSGTELKKVAVDEIEPNPDQPRKTFNPKKMEELTRSIETQGVIEPLVLCPDKESGYQIVAGERRWRAACQAGLDVVPAIVRELTEKQALTIALIENIQRENLNPVEEARAFQRLLDKQNLSQEKLAAAIGKSRSAIANRIRLLRLPDDIKKALEQGDISAGHARALLGLSSEEEMLKFYKRILKHGYSVRQTEDKIQKLIAEKENPPAPKEEKQTPTHFQRLEAELENSVGAPIEITSKDRKSGCIQIFFNNPDEFELLRERLKKIQIE